MYKYIFPHLELRSDPDPNPKSFTAEPDPRKKSFGSSSLVFPMGIRRVVKPHFEQKTGCSRNLGIRHSTTLKICQPPPSPTILEEKCATPRYMWCMIACLGESIFGLVQWTTRKVENCRDLLHGLLDSWTLVLMGRGHNRVI